MLSGAKIIEIVRSLSFPFTGRYSFVLLAMLSAKSVASSLLFHCHNEQ